MSNKIKDIFSDDTFNINGTLHFRDDEAYKNFLSALEIASIEGRAVPVSGVTSVTTTVGHQGVKFPLEEYTNVTQLFVGPAVEALNTNTVANNNLGACSFDVSTEISSNKRIGGIENGRDL